MGSVSSTAYSVSSHNWDWSRVVIVVGYKGQNLIDYIGHRYDDRLKIEYVNNPVYDKTNKYLFALTCQR